MNGWRLRTADRQKGPVTLPFRSLLDPATQDEAIGVRQPLCECGGRHALVGRFRADSPPEFAVVGFARRDDAGFSGCAEQALTRVQPQISLAFVLVRTMTGKAAVRQDGPHVAIELDYG